MSAVTTQFMECCIPGCYCQVGNSGTNSPSSTCDTCPHALATHTCLVIVGGNVINQASYDAKSKENALRRELLSNPPPRLTSAAAGVESPARTPQFQHQPQPLPLQQSLAPPIAATGQTLPFQQLQPTPQQLQQQQRGSAQSYSSASLKVPERSSKRSFQQVAYGDSSYSVDNETHVTPNQVGIARGQIFRRGSNSTPAGGSGFESSVAAAATKKQPPNRSIAQINVPQIFPFKQKKSAGAGGVGGGIPQYPTGIFLVHDMEGGENENINSKPSALVQRSDCYF